MNNVTKMKIMKPAHEVFEAFVDPTKIGNFWFSSSSATWIQGKTITLRYEEYNAQVEIEVVEIQADKKIVFKWGTNTVSILLDEIDESTIIEVVEEGFDENDKDLLAKMLDNKEGWVFMLTCLKAYLESGVNQIRGGLVK